MKKYILVGALLCHINCSAVQVRFVPQLVSTIWLSLIMHGLSVLLATEEAQDHIQKCIEQRENKIIDIL